MQSAGSILLIAPSPPPYGGMALQARLLEKLLLQDCRNVVFFASNFPLTGWLKPLGNLPGTRTIARPAVIIGRARGVRVILNYRGGGGPEFFDRARLMLRPIFRLADIVTAPSEFLAEAIRRKFGVPVTIVPNILEGEGFRFRERLPLRPRLLVARHLEKIYDIESVLRAFRIVQQRFPDTTLAIAGNGPERDHLRHLVLEWNLQSVEFLGHVEHQDLPAVYDRCDIFVNASKIDNFPGALLEASKAGLVVISTCAGGIPFIYQNEKNALLVEPGDWRALAQAIERVLDSPATAQSLIRAATAVVQVCEWSEVSKRLYRAYGITDEEAVGVH
jgi:glycosyltransferase involved in cell wall biosynthesis